MIRRVKRKFSRNIIKRRLAGTTTTTSQGLQRGEIAGRMDKVMPVTLSPLINYIY
jgi:hypothetical protein